MLQRILLVPVLAVNALESQPTSQRVLIHGRQVSAECLAAYKALFVPEQQRVQALLRVSQLVMSPPELRTRAENAATATAAYQAALEVVDEKLADPLTMEDKANLETAVNAQSDVGPTLTSIGKLVEAADYSGSPELKAAYLDFKRLREIEVKAAGIVDAACPDDFE